MKTDQFHDNVFPAAPIYFDSCVDKLCFVEFLLR